MDEPDEPPEADKSLEPVETAALVFSEVPVADWLIII